MFELEVWQAPITDNQGNILPGAQITVFNSDDTVATIYDDLDRAPRSNPFTVGTDALARFYAEPGRYRVQAQSGTDIAVYDNVDLSQKSIREDLGSPAGGTLVKLASGKSVQEYSDQFSDENLQAAVTEAETAADRAETAENTTAIRADIYADTASGIAATSSGEQFQVLEGDEFIRYANDAGTAVEVGRFLASSGFKIEAQANRVPKANAQGVIGLDWLPRSGGGNNLPVSLNSNSELIPEFTWNWGNAAQTDFSNLSTKAPSIEFVRTGSESTVVRRFSGDFAATPRFQTGETSSISLSDLNVTEGDTVSGGLKAKLVFQNNTDDRQLRVLASWRNESEGLISFITTTAVTMNTNGNDFHEFEFSGVVPTGATRVRFEFNFITAHTSANGLVTDVELGQWYLIKGERNLETYTKDGDFDTLPEREIMYVDISAGSTVTVYIKNSKIDQPYFIAYPIRYFNITASNYTGWSFAAAHEAIRQGRGFVNSGRFSGDIFGGGVTEYAWRESAPGTPDFIGGTAHGDENTVRVFCEIDGELFDPATDSGLFACTSFKFVTNTILNSANDINLDLISRTRIYDFDAYNHMRLRSFNEWVGSVEFDKIYHNMMTLNAGLFNTYYTDRTAESKTVGAVSEVLQGESREYTAIGDNVIARVEVKESPDVGEVKSVFHATTGKLYFDILSGQSASRVTPQVGDEWRFDACYKIDTY